MKLAAPITLCITALIGLMLAGVSARAQDDHKKWLVCAENSDCIVIPASVCDGQISINKAYYKAYEDYDASFTGFGECPQSPPNDPDAVASCLNNVCTLSPPKKIISK